MKLSILENISQSFTNELMQAEAGEQTSLAYIKNSIPEKSIVEGYDQFQVFVIGGTVFRSAMCRRMGEEIMMENVQVHSPDRFNTREDFLSFFTEKIHPDVSVVAINFAYPLAPIFTGGHLDGVLITGSKENNFEGVVGEQIGQLITDELVRRRGQHVSVSCANDTLCLLLSGISKYPAEKLFCGIIGTGVNFAFFRQPREIINLESSNFDKFPQSNTGQEIDRESVYPGKALFEKETSGAYLYKHYNILFASHPIQSTQQLNEIAQGTDHGAEIARDLFDHSASLIACQVAGILNFRKQDMIGVMEGSLFWDAEHYKTLVESYVSMLSKYHVDFVSIDEESIIGAAMLVAS